MKIWKLLFLKCLYFHVYIHYNYLFIYYYNYGIFYLYFLHMFDYIINMMK